MSHLGTKFGCDDPVRVAELNPDEWERDHRAAFIGKTGVVHEVKLRYLGEHNPNAPEGYLVRFDESVEVKPGRHVWQFHFGPQELELNDKPRSEGFSDDIP